MLLLSLLAAVSCTQKNRIKNSDTSAGNNIITTAKRLTISQYGTFTRVIVLNPWQGAEGVKMIYYLVRRGNAPPPGTDSSLVIFVPLEKIVCMSTTHIAMISALGEENTIKGMSGTGLMFSEELNEMAQKGLIKDVGYEANLNKELILQIMPEVTMIYGVGSESSGYIGKIRELGIKVMYNADYLETDPLGKAEWIKLFGALYCRETMADSIFKKESEAYNDLRSLIAEKVIERPKVLLGLPFRDTWFISPGNSFISKLIGDAGGDYLWKDTESAVSMPYGLENVFLRAMKADYWLNIGTVRSKREISATDPRLGELPCFTSGHLFNNNKRITGRGGNDFWEGGTVYPHLILKDMATILHPAMFPDDTLCYYRKIL